MYKLTVYVPEKDEDLVKDFLISCRSRGVTASSVILEWMRSQQQVKQLDLKPEVCRLCGKSTMDLVDARFVSGQRFKVCSACFQDRERKGLVRSVIGSEPFNPNLFGVQKK